MEGYYQTQWIFILLFTAWTWSGSQAAEGSVAFPAEWHGQWFQSGLGLVSISERTLTKKGTIIDKRRDYYLIENTDVGCYQCMLITHRHHNILQYKESYCLAKGSMKQICDTISTDGILYTLIREYGAPIRCPFQDSYHFSYDNNTGHCSYPLSYVRGCASDTRFQFHFKHCDGLWETRNLDLDFECLATWKDGSDYLYGRYSGTGMHDRERQYRCFMYNVQGNMVKLSQSADATCRGLISATDGPMKMELSRDQFGWPVPTCQFPDWLGDHTWRDLTGDLSVVVDLKNQVIRFHRQTSEDPHPITIIALRCLHISEKNTSGSKFVAVSYSSDECSSRHQCIKLVRRSDAVLELHRGADVEGQTQECHGRDFKQASKQLLIASTIKGVKCPFSGRFLSESGSCAVSIRSGCNTSSQMQIQTACSEIPAGNLECLTTWREKESMYMIAKQPGQKHRLANCFRFRNQSEGMVTLQTDRHCNMRVPNIFNTNIKYSFKNSPERCYDVPPANRGSRGGGASKGGQTRGRTTAEKQPVVRGSANTFYVSPLCTLTVSLLYIINSLPR